MHITAYKNNDLCAQINDSQVKNIIIEILILLAL